MVVDNPRQEVHYIRAHITGKSHVHFEGSFSKENCVVVDGEVVRNLLSLDRPIRTVVPQSRSNSKLFSDVTLSTSDFTGGRRDFIAPTLFDISNILDELRKLAVTVS